MSRQTRTAITLLCLLLNLGVQAIASEPLTEEERARRTQELSFGLRLTQKTTFHSGYLFIRDLIRTPQSKNYRLTMTTNQEHIIILLDRLLLNARLDSFARDADYLETNPRDFEAYLKRSKQRQRQALRHGQLMTLTGLLTPTQTRHALRDYISVRKWKSFQINLIQELFDLNAAQKQQLLRAQADYNQSTKPLFMESMRPGADRDDIQAGIQLFKEEYRQESLQVLNSEQRKKYDLLKIRPPILDRLPSTPPLSTADQHRLDLSLRSSVFRLIKQQQNELNLSAKQLELLQQLTLVTQHGLLWIETPSTQAENAPDNARDLFDHSQAAFLKHAEQIALQGILSEQQAREILDAR